MVASPDTTRSAERRTRCSEAVERADGYRLSESPGQRAAAFCRLEHVVPWAIQGAHWDPGELTEPPGIDQGALHCSQCGAELGEVRVICVRHRGEHRVPDAFCSV